jgi:hypothetical protein
MRTPNIRMTTTSRAAVMYPSRLFMRGSLPQSARSRRHSRPDPPGHLDHTSGVGGGSLSARLIGAESGTAHGVAGVPTSSKERVVVAGAPVLGVEQLTGAAMGAGEAARVQPERVEG